MTDPFNSPFGSAFISSLSGAFVGALGAYLTAIFTSIRRDRLDSLRASNNAVVLATTCANMAMSLKVQHVRPLVRKFIANQERAENVYADNLLLGTPMRHEVEADFVSLTPLILPIETLKNFVYSMNLADARAVGAMAQLDQSIAELNKAIDVREELIAEFKVRGAMDERYLCDYLGLVDESGSINESYASALQGIGQYVDDVIFFSVFLAEKLTQHAALIKKSLYKIRSKVPTPHTVDFSMARCQALVPENMDYESWLRAMQDRIH